MRIRIAVVLAVALCASVALGENSYTWNPAVTTGNWSDPGSWNPAGPPAAGDNATIGPGVNVSTAITLDAPATLNNFAFSGTGGFASLTVSGPNTLTINGTASVDFNGIFGQSWAASINSVVAGTAAFSVNRGRLYLGADNTFGGGMTIGGAGAGAGVRAVVDGALSSGPVTVNALGELELFVPQTDAPVITVNSGGAIYLDTQSPTGNVYSTNVALNSGYLYQNEQGGTGGGGVTMNGSITVTGTGNRISGGGRVFYHPVTYNGDIIGAAGTKIDFNPNGDGADTQIGHLNRAAASYQGNWTVTNGNLYVDQDGAMGVGAGQSVAVNGGILYFTVNQTNFPSITVNPAGTITNSINRGVSPLSANFTLAGGKAATAGAAATEYSGAITLTANSTFETAARDMYITGGIAGAFKATKTGTATMYLNSANTFGSMEVQAGTVVANALGCLGGGAIVAKGGALRSNVDGSFSSAGSITADADGTVVLNSTETKQITVKAGGAFNVTGGLTPLVYTKGSGNIQVEAGCILYEGMTGYPAITDFFAGDGGFGAFKGATTPGPHVVGQNSGTIYRGLAASSNATFAGTVTEAPGPGADDGVGFLAASPATWTFNTPVSVTAQASNTIKLYGKGHFVFNTTAMAGFNNNIEMLGSGMMRISAAGGVPAGKTVYVRNGGMGIDVPGAIAGTVELTTQNWPDGSVTGGALNISQILTGGTINVRNGAAVYADNAGNFGAGTITWDEGSTYGFQVSWITSLPLPNPGKVNYQVWNINPDGPSEFDVNVVLGNNTRLSVLPNFDGTTQYITFGNSGGTGAQPILLDTAAGATQGTFSAPRGNFVQVDNQVDFTKSGGGAGTLIAGDASGKWRSLTKIDPNVANRVHMIDIFTDGTVRLTNAANVIGALDVRSGTLRGTSQGALGGTNLTTAKIASGARLQLAFANPTLVGVDITGGGATTGYVMANAGADTLTVQRNDANTAGAVSPGTSAGILTVEGSLAFAKNAGGNPARVIIDILGVGGVAGVDFDRLLVTNNLNLGGNASLNVLFGPAITQSMLRDQSMSIAGYGGTLTGQFSNMIDASNIVVGTDGLATINYAGGSGKEIVLSKIVIHLYLGDSDRDGDVDFTDYQHLEANFGITTGGTWDMGDFDRDGDVDFTDYQYLESNFGSGVPEPMTLGLLTAGGLALVARRRR